MGTSFAPLGDREPAYRGQVGKRTPASRHGVGGHLLRRVIAAFPEAKNRVPQLRMIVVAGPRIDPGSLPAHDGLEIRPTSTSSTATWPPAISRSWGGLTSAATTARAVLHAHRTLRWQGSAGLALAVRNPVAMHF